MTSTHQHMKLRLIAEFAKAGISKSELAKRLGVDEKQARRLLDVRMTSSIDSIEAAFNALGLSLHVKIGR